jgi:hypothetical protein
MVIRTGLDSSKLHRFTIDQIGVAASQYRSPARSCFGLWHAGFPLFVIVYALSKLQPSRALN